MNDRYIPLEDREVEEERRLLYVAMTRAKQDLIITFHEMFEEGIGYLRFEAITRFLRDIQQYLAVVNIAAQNLK